MPVAMSMLEDDMACGVGFENTHEFGCSSRRVSHIVRRSVGIHDMDETPRSFALRGDPVCGREGYSSTPPLYVRVEVHHLRISECQSCTACSSRDTIAGSKFVSAAVDLYRSQSVSEDSVSKVQRTRHDEQCVRV